MPEDYCQCGNTLNSERNKRLDRCRSCEKLENRKVIEDTKDYVESLPDMRCEDRLVYIIEKQPEFDD